MNIFNTARELTQLQREKYNYSLGIYNITDISFRFIATQAQGNIHTAAWHISSTSGF